MKAPFSIVRREWDPAEASKWNRPSARPVRRYVGSTTTGGNMNTSSKALLLGAAFLMSTASPALAQGTTTDAGTTVPVRDDDDDDGDEGKWGLLGLLGLAGLLGLKRRDRDDHRSTSTTTADRR
jgi:MYXO-CTERM domain-containing protein